MYDYDYWELREACIINPSQQNLSDLADWFRRYGMDYWNGENWDADGYTLTPIYVLTEDTGEWELSHYEWD